MSDYINIEVDGKRYEGWKNVSVRRSMGTLCGSFSFESMDRWSVLGEDWVLFPGKQCRVSVGNELLAVGYIDAVSPSISGSSHSIAISGRDRTADLVDCSVDLPEMSWRNVTLLDIADKLLAPFGVEAYPLVDLGDPFTKFTVKSGESVFEALSRAAQKRSVLILTDNEGNLYFNNTGTDSANDSLETGLNILEASSTFDFKNRFASYKVRGQSKTAGDGWTKSTIQVVGEAEDEEVTRTRPKILSVSGISSTKDAQNKARWEAHVRAGKSFTANVSVRGFHQSNGILWTVNEQVLCKIPQLLLDSWMLITGVEYNLSSAGELTRLTLARRDAFEAEPERTVKAQPGLGW